jgi:hypothetical protein
VADLVAPLLPAVVNIETFTDTGPSHNAYFWGSGIIIEPSCRADCYWICLNSCDRGLA